MSRIRFAVKQTLGVAACLLMAPAAASAQTAADRAFAQCGTISDASARLACYDTAREQSKDTHWPEFSPTPPPIAAKPAPQIAPRPLPLPQNGELVATVARYNLSPRERFTVVLDNGEIWRQLDSDDGVAQFNRRARNVVQISKGFWGSYNLRLNSANTVFKVTRIK